MILDNRRIALVQPPISLSEIYGGLAKVGAVSPPLNLLLLAAIVREKGYKPCVIDCPAWGLKEREVLARLKRIGPKYIGMTAMTPHIVQAARLAEAVKKELPNATVLVGGAHVSAVPIETMERFPWFDIGFVGEADHSLPQLLEATAQGCPATDIKGIIVRKNGKVILSGGRTDRVDMNSLPYYAWDLLEGYPRVYKPPLFSTHQTPVTSIVTSRGCPGKCIFCYSGCHMTVSTYSAEYIVGMLSHLKNKFRIREFMIYDDNFVMYKNNLIKTLTLMIQKRLDLTWSCNARVDMVDRKTLNLMARAGCWQISYGIETGNQGIMDRLGKGISKGMVRNAVKMSRDAGIRTVGYFMIGHFGESQETVEETIQFACDIGLDDFRMSYFTPLPGTQAAPMAGQFGQFDNDWEKMNLFSPVFVPEGMSRDQLIRGQKRAMRKFFMRPKPIWSFAKMAKNPEVLFKGAYSIARYFASS